MKISLNKPCLGLDGNHFTNDSLGKILGQSLALQSKGDAIKLIDWAGKLYKGEDLELDRSDFNWLKEFISNSESIFVIAKGPLLKEFIEFKESE